MQGLDPEEFRKRKLELIDSYADAVRTAIAFDLLTTKRRNTTLRVINEHTMNVLYLIVKLVDVEPWPPSADTHAKVDKILAQYLAGI